MSSASPCPGSASATCGGTSPAPVPTRRRRRARAGWIDLATRIKLTYAQHHVHLTSIRYAQENLDLMRRVAEIARTRYASGFGGQQDALRAQSEIIAMETDLVMLEGESAQASARMRALLGRPENVKLRPPEKLRPLPPVAAGHAALEAGCVPTTPSLPRTTRASPARRRGATWSSATAIPT
jgi:cobalt-zinc-cadmium efflux system outer membrane protein